jgi:hypothetical protein
MNDWYKEVRKTIGQYTMMVPRFEGYNLDKDVLLRYNDQIYVPPNGELRSFELKRIS